MADPVENQDKTSPANPGQSTPDTAERSSIVPAFVLTGLCLPAFLWLYLSANSLSWQQLINLLQQGLYWPNHNAFPVKFAGPLAVNQFIGLVLMACLIMVFMFYCARPPRINNTSSSDTRPVNIVIYIFLAITIILQTAQQWRVFSKEFQENQGKTTEAQYAEFLTFKEDYRFAQFCQKHLPRKQRVNVLTDWTPSGINDNRTHGRWVYLRYFIYPIQISLNAPALDYWLIIVNDPRQMKHLPDDVEIFARFDTRHAIARRKRPPDEP